MRRLARRAPRRSPDFYRLPTSDYKLLPSPVAGSVTSSSSQKPLRQAPLQQIVSPQQSALELQSPPTPLQVSTQRPLAQISVPGQSKSSQHAAQYVPQSSGPLAQTQAPPPHTSPSPQSSSST